ncbi:MAG: hypothetical protein QMC98_01640 [Candidatus Thermoplasmatota archaeon]|nr:hypothetical protein [Candidatus Thermoplasmatota archaeon]
MSKKEEKQVDKGLEITFMHLREILRKPEKVDEYISDTNFFPVYLEEKGKKALLLGIKPSKLPR